MSRAHPPAPALDPLAAVLGSLRLVAAECARIELAQPWAVEVPPIPSAQLHFLTEGELWIEPEGQARQVLTAGAAWLVSSCSGYRLGAGPPIPAISLAEAQLRGQSSGYTRQVGGAGPRATLLCVQCDLGPRVVDPLAGALPACTVSHEVPPTLSGLVRILDQIMLRGGEGSSILALRVAEVCLLDFLRHWLDDPGRAAEPGWLAALQHPGLSRALGAMMASPEAPHDLDSLARLSAMSRSSFASRFHQRVGLPPMTWLRRWRLQRAGQLLLDGETVERAACSVGFASTSAFSRAFLRLTGSRPGAWSRHVLGASVEARGRPG